MDTSEHTFGTSERAEEQAPGYGELLDEFRTHTTDWVQARRDDLVGEQGRLHVAELAAVCVLDERRVQRAPEPGLTHRALRDELEVARALESMPAIAEAASSGALSWDQLKGIVEVATPATDAEWAERAPHWAPADLVRQARAAKVVTGEDAAARREARELRWWDDAARGADAWDTLAHRGADAFVDLCQNYADVTPTRRHRPLIVMHTNGMSAEVDGIPIGLETLDARRDEARDGRRPDFPVLPPRRASSRGRQPKPRHREQSWERPEVVDVRPYPHPEGDGCCGRATRSRSCARCSPITPSPRVSW